MQLPVFKKKKQPVKQNGDIVRVIQGPSNIW